MNRCFSAYVAAHRIHLSPPVFIHRELLSVWGEGEGFNVAYLGTTEHVPCNMQGLLGRHGALE